MTYSHRLHADMLPADSPHSPGMKCATGSQAFSEKVLKIGKSLIKKDRHWSYQQSQEQKAHGQLEAERLLAEERRIAGLKESGLPNRLLSYKPAKFPGGDLRKIAISSRIARTIIVNLEWIN